MFRPVALAALLLTGALTLAGCGADGVMHDGSEAASSDGTSVSSSNLQQAVEQINATAGGQTRITAAEVIPYVVLAPKFDALAARYNVGVSNDQIRSRFPGKELSQTTLDAYRANVIYATSQASTAPAALAAAGRRVISDSHITVNPRFGSLSSGVVAPAYADWLAGSDSTAD